MNAIADAATHGVESPYAWRRLAAGLTLSTLGGVGMWSVVVALPAMQADFGVDRASASVPFTLTMVGFGLGNIVMGRLADRFGIALPMMLGTVLLSLGYVLTGLAGALWQVSLLHGALIGFGSSTLFGPLMADMSHWFSKRRGRAVAIAATGNYLAGAFWPLVVSHFIESSGWRATHIGIGIFLIVAMTPLILVMRRRLVEGHSDATTSGDARRRAESPFSPRTLQILLCIAGVACCVAMAMPQVHLVAYCSDLGYGAARGAEMLSAMLALGIISRVGSGFIADKIGGVRTLLIGSLAQGVALFLYLPFNGLYSLYVISAMFGLFQGGIVPSYAIIVREYFSPKEASTRVGLVIFSTVIGMAVGGWMSGKIFDLTGSYQAAFLNGIAFNAINVTIMLWLLFRSSRPRPALAAA
ncbi:MFS transporter [Undibacter mobilis]|uniref:MFS transporter n=1 Tax=Undibacter mobilis TaxID=2292256 RepID=A0A371BDP0_9BRAD|nr:MFS transporter [Undibacter mobilis]RDV05670.1 MFS transporter [Undibacter mobilis]